MTPHDKSFDVMLAPAMTQDKLHGTRVTSAMWAHQDIKKKVTTFCSVHKQQSGWKWSSCNHVGMQRIGTQLMHTQQLGTSSNQNGQHHAGI